MSEIDSYTLREHIYDFEVLINDNAPSYVE